MKRFLRIWAAIPGGLALVAPATAQQKPALKGSEKPETKQP